MSAVLFASGGVERLSEPLLYAGTDAEQTIQTTVVPSMILFKDRVNANPSVIYDNLTGLMQPLRVVTSNLPGQNVNGLKSFSPLIIGSEPETNTNGAYALDYAALSFTKKAKFFTIITWLGDGAASKTIAHDLGVAPEFIIVKSQSSTQDFAVYHKNLTAANSLRLNTNAGQASAATEFPSGPDASNITVGSGNNVNQSGFRYVAYLFVSMPGVSWFGSFSGNGSTTGPITENLSFYPRTVIIKRIDTSGDWMWYSRNRNAGGTPPTQYYLLKINVAGAEASGVNVDFLNTGFQPKTTDTRVNASGGTYAVCAFA